MNPSSLFVRFGVALAATITVATATATATATDWVLSRPGGSCDEACGGSCHAEGTAQITSPARIRYVAEITGAGRCDAVVEEAVFGNEPAIDRVTSPHSHCVHLPAGSRAAVDCAAGWGNEERFCCCGDDCPVDPPPEEPLSCPKRHHDWVLSREGDSCDEACAIRGKPCGDAPGLQTSHAMEYVSCLLGLRCDALGPNPTPLLGIEPSVFSSNGSNTCYYRTAPYTSECDGAFPREKRICCCGSDCPLSG